jgi:hypothetical protein
LLEGLGGDVEVGGLWKGYQILGMDKKPKQKIETLFIRH